jgi:lipoyl(octanoyl) transferase
MTVSVCSVLPGVLPYRVGLALQETLHKRVKEDPSQQFVIGLEHLPVITLGKHAATEHVLASEEWFQSEGVTVVRASRGGEVTVHMPGQLVLYPILHLGVLKLMPKQYIHLLEEAVIRTLASRGITAQRDREYPGVWVGQRKICAVGVRIKDRISLHGIALNVINDLSLFSQVVPCGIVDRGVTSMRMERPSEVLSVQAIAAELLGNLAHLLGSGFFQPVALTELAIAEQSLYNQTHTDI